MKLLLLLPSENRGGAEEYALTIGTAAIREKGWDVHVAFPTTKGTTSLISDFIKQNIFYHSLDIASISEVKNKLFKEYLPHLFRTLSLLIKLRPDLIYIVLPWPYLGEASILACGFLKIPTLVVFQLFPYRLHYRKLRLKAYAWAASRNQKWIAVSRNNCKFARDSFNLSEDQMICIYNGTNTSSEFADYDPDEITDLRCKVRQELGISETSKLLLTVGRLSHQKGYNDFVQIIPHIVKEFPDIRFIWIGEGELREHLMKEVKDRGLEEEVLFLGYRSDIPRWLKAADLFIFPTHFEGQPFVLNEAMSHGLPIVSSDASGIPEIIEDRIHGLLFPTGNAHQLLQAIRWALNHPEEMQKMAKNAQVRAQEFSKEKMIYQTFDVLKDLSKKL